MELPIFAAQRGWEHNLGVSDSSPPRSSSFFARLTFYSFSPSHRPDAVLTPNGIAQAQAANIAWKAADKLGAPLPQVLYSSPMRRAASTLKITWGDILLQKKSFVPIFREHYVSRAARVREARRVGIDFVSSLFLPGSCAHLSRENPSVSTPATSALPEPSSRPTTPDGSSETRRLPIRTSSGTRRMRRRPPDRLFDFSRR